MTLMQTTVTPNFIMPATIMKYCCEVGSVAGVLLAAFNSTLDLLTPTVALMSATVGLIYYSVLIYDRFVTSKNKKKKRK